MGDRAGCGRTIDAGKRGVFVCGSPSDKWAPTWDRRCDDCLPRCRTCGETMPQVTRRYLGDMLGVATYETPLSDGRCDSCVAETEERQTRGETDMMTEERQT